MKKEKTISFIDKWLEYLSLAVLLLGITVCYFYDEHTGANDCNRDCMVEFEANSGAYIECANTCIWESRPGWNNKCLYPNALADQ